jgi:hypothetical protein
MIQILKQFKQWWRRRKPSQPLHDFRSIQRLAEEMPDELSEAMASRLKLNAQRHRKRQQDPQER